MRQTFIFCVFLLITAVSCTDCDAETSCSDSETCCKLGDNLWGCCPMENAVCCDDHTHCCPQGSQCDPQGARCIHAEGHHSLMQKKRPATKTVIRNEFKEVICPDEASKCPDGSTCCMLEQGNFGCCPVPQAVCCPDMLHCCPHGFTCHGQFCSQKYAKIPHLNKFKSTSIHRKPAIEFVESVPIEEDENSDEKNSEENDDILDEFAPITCGSGKTCPSKTTCCAIQQEDGSYNHLCCPLSNAVCCKDTCCPSGYHCIGGGKCEKRASALSEIIWN